jgi:uncharacterized repeat protein (TIGR01451 family)
MKNFGLNRNQFPYLALLVLLLLIVGLADAKFSSGPPDGRTGAPNEGFCTDCHSGTPTNGSISISGLPTQYDVATTYTITVTLQDPGQQRWGFELTAVDENGDGIGKFTIIDAVNTQLSDNVGTQRDYVKHTSAGSYAGTANGPVTWQVEWTSPALIFGDVAFYVAGNAADNNNATTGDNIYAGYYLTEGKNPGSISGQVIYEPDCIYHDSDNTFLPEWLVVLENGDTTLTSESDLEGNYGFILLPADNYNVVIVEKPDTISVCPENGIFNIILGEGENSIDNRYFMKCTTSVDVSVDITASGDGIRGHWQTFYIHYDSHSSRAVYGVSLSASFSPKYIETGPTSWTIDEIPPFGKGKVTTEGLLSILAGAGTELIVCARIGYGDVCVESNSENNYVCDTTIVTTPIDPNDKTALPLGFGPLNFIQKNDSLVYRINFQNVGTAPAFDVIVVDTIDSDLDLATFELIDFSHPHTLSQDDREVKWTFTNIQLPDSLSDEPNSHGYITYKIWQNSELSPGTEIRNSAWIKFDYEPWIETNEVLRTIAHPSTCGDVNMDGAINIKDITDLIKFKYKGGSSPRPSECYGDVNNDNAVNIKDITDLIKYKYKDGDAPDENCCNPIW